MGGPAITLHGAEVRYVASQADPVTVGAALVGGLVGTAPNTSGSRAASATVGAGNSAIRFVADEAGEAGNGIRVRIVAGQAGGALLVAVESYTVTVTLAAGGEARLDGAGGGHCVQRGRRGIGLGNREQSGNWRGQRAADGGVQLVGRPRRAVSGEHVGAGSIIRAGLRCWAWPGRWRPRSAMCGGLRGTMARRSWRRVLPPDRMRRRPWPTSLGAGQIRQGSTLFWTRRAARRNARRFWRHRDTPKPNRRWRPWKPWQRLGGGGGCRWSTALGGRRST